MICLPLARDGVRSGGTEFLSDRPLDRLPLPDTLEPDAGDESTQPYGDVNDEPFSFHPRHRAYRARPLYRRTVPLPQGLHSGLGAEYLDALHAYLARPPPDPHRREPSVTVWLTRIVTDPSSADARRDIAAAGGAISLHRRLMSLFPPGIGEAARARLGVLFRTEDTPAGTHILMQSPTNPTPPVCPPATAPLTAAPSTPSSTP